MAWAPDYTDSESFKSYARIDADDTLDDAEIALAISAASRAVDDYCKRQFGSLEGTRHYTPEWSEHYLRWLVRIDDLQGSPTSIHLAANHAAAFEAVTVADCTMLPMNAQPDGLAFTALLLPWRTVASTDVGTVRVAATFGWTAVPTAVEQATLLQALRFFKRKDSPYGVAGSPEMGSEIRLLSKLDPDVCVMLRHYRRLWVSA